MSKIGKKYNLFSDGAIKAEKLYLALKNLEKNNIFIQDVKESFNVRQNEYNGNITLKLQNTSEPFLADFANLVNSPFFNDYKQYDTSINFTVDTHYESLVELKNNTIGDSENIFKFEAPFKYNFLVKKYEDYLQQNTSIDETGLPYFYKVLKDFVTQDNYNNFSGSDFFEEPTKVVKQSDPNLKFNVIPSKVSRQTEDISLEKYINKFFVYKSQFPFYADIKFDTHELDEKSIISILNEKNISARMMQQFIDLPTTSSLYFSLIKKVPSVGVQLINSPTTFTLSEERKRALQKAKEKANEFALRQSNGSIILKESPIEQQVVIQDGSEPIVNAAVNAPLTSGRVITKQISEKVLEAIEDFESTSSSTPPDKLVPNGRIQELLANHIEAATNPENDNTLLIDSIDVEGFLLNELRNATNTGDFSFIASINQAIDNKSRSFLEILMGDNEYTEIIGYRLKKTLANEQTNEPYTQSIQEWFIPNVFEGQINWVDTQIKYNKLYSYKLDPIVLTFATDFKISSITRRGTDEIIINFVNKPRIKAYVLNGKVNNPRETLGATYVNKLLDFPPLEPEIEIVPFIGIDKQIKLNFNTSIGKKTVPYVVVDEQERSMVKQLQKAQNLDEDSHLLTFSSDEPSAQIELFRTDIKPKSYEEFFSSKLKTISTNGTSGASFIDDIIPNKKYYYVARSKDYHNNVSNPTVIYEVELTSDNGLIIPNISLVEFDKEENKKQLSKSFKRYVKIQPSVRHRLVNDEKVKENDIELGNDSVKPWGKKFKLRITSKSTGKKMDINFVFKYNKPQ